MKEERERERKEGMEKKKEGSKYRVIRERRLNQTLK